MRFCTKCGAHINNAPKPVYTPKTYGSPVSMSKIICSIPLILLAVMGIVFFYTAISDYDSASLAFDFVGDSEGVMGVCLYWILLFIYLSFSVETNINYWAKQKNPSVVIANAVPLIVISIFMYVFDSVIDHMSVSSTQIVISRCIYTYIDLMPFAIVTGVVMFIFGILSAAMENGTR